MSPRVLLADDHIIFAEALTHVLCQKYEVIETVRDGKALLLSARKHKPDVIVTDITMPLMNGLDCVRSLRKDPYTPKFIFLTMHADSDLARECFNSGGSAFVTKESCYDELLVAIEAVLDNHTYVSPSIAAGLIDGLRDPSSEDDMEPLTLRQREILQLFAEGKTMKEIATLTDLSTRTVEWHKYRMMKMLHVRHSSELVQHALRLKLVA
jgi:DNA-binding NarL/FixJ family response regulator